MLTTRVSRHFSKSNLPNDFLAEKNLPHLIYRITILLHNLITKINVETTGPYKWYDSGCAHFTKKGITKYTAPHTVVGHVRAYRLTTLSKCATCWRMTTAQWSHNYVSIYKLQIVLVVLFVKSDTTFSVFYQKRDCSVCQIVHDILSFWLDTGL